MKTINICIHIKGYLLYKIYNYYLELIYDGTKH